MCIYIYGTPRRYPGCVLFQSNALSLMFVCVPSSLRLWESKFSFTMAPEASKCSVYCICAPELSPSFMECAGNVGKTNIFYDLSVGNHENCWFYQHFQQFPWFPKLRLSRSFSGMVENVGFTNIVRRYIFQDGVNCYRNLRFSRSYVLVRGVLQTSR